ncbi:MAG: hypothetical protein FJ291_20815 [Planctomycetes bacterium]|nr:hypothetical protein [Planctomycetota bacterium]
MASDWVTRNIAERRTHEHHADFDRLARMAWDYGHGRWVADSEWRFLWDCESRNPVFADIRYELFA